MQKEARKEGHKKEERKEKKGAIKERERKRKEVVYSPGCYSL